jgi:hypothetical protein
LSHVVTSAIQRVFESRTQRLIAPP